MNLKMENLTGAQEREKLGIKHNSRKETRRLQERRRTCQDETTSRNRGQCPLPPQMSPSRVSQRIATENLHFAPLKVQDLAF